MMNKTKPKTAKVTLIEPTTGASAKGWHAIVDFLRCPEEYRLRHLVGARLPLESTPDPLGIGSLVHWGCAKWHESGCPMWSEKLDVQLGAWLEQYMATQKLPIRSKAEREARWYTMQYIKHWGGKSAPKILAVEYLLGPTSIVVGDKSPLFQRTARLDAVGVFAESGGRLAILETKTTSVGVNDAVNEYQLHGQPMLQALLWKLSPQGEALHGPIAGVLVDVIHKKYDKDEEGSRVIPGFGRQLVPITDFQLQWFAQVMALHLREASLVTKDSLARRNPTACTRLIGRMRKPCDFRNLCQYGPSARSQFVGPDGKTLSADVVR